MENTAQQAGQVQKSERERTHKCKNHMLEGIHSMKNLSVNGNKDSEYSDIIRFEDMFENWDQRAILLTEWDWYRTGDEPYVYFSPIGIYTSIGLFARKLQRLLPHDKEISVMLMGEDLKITIYKDGEYLDHKGYEAKTIHLDQIDDGFHHDGWKFELLEMNIKESLKVNS